jgi:hypothetical protein
MIVLKNEGEIDIKTITTMGVNIKTRDSPIGYFGTGLKYAIAVFLRHGLEAVELYIGKNRYEFIAEPCLIRDKEFQLCKLVGRYDSIDLGFTTDLGRNWELWQAYREIESNCRDEGGEVYESHVVEGEEGFTKFVLSPIPGIEEVFLDNLGKHKIFGDKSIEIYAGTSNHIYYRGIRAKDLPKPSQYTYNILEYCTLTEDRLLCYDFQVEKVINNAIAQLDNKKVIKRVITSTKEHYEGGLTMDVDCDVSPKEAFLEAAKEGRVMRGVHQYIAQHQPKVPMTLKERAEQLRKEIVTFCEARGLKWEIDEHHNTRIKTSDLFQEFAADATVTSIDKVYGEDTYVDRIAEADDGIPF